MNPHRPHLVIIPSPLILGRTYRKLARELNNDFQVHVIELPGSGAEPGFWRTWPEEDSAQWLFARMKELKIQRPFILGHSNSGNVAIQMALSSPEKISGLMLADTTGTKRKSYLTVLAGRFLDAFYEWRFTLWASFHLLLNIILHPLNFFYQLRLAVKRDFSSQLPKLKIPVLVAWGKRDHTVSLETARRLNGLLPRSFLRVFNKGSHDWVITHPKVFAPMARQFKNSQKLN